MGRDSQLIHQSFSQVTVSAAEANGNVDELMLPMSH